MDLAAATDFVWTHARLIDRRRFAHLFLGADPAPVADAVRAYANPDGGFGNALEPDLRDPHSQPIAVETAIRVLREAGAGDDPLVGRAADWLASVALPDGSVPMAVPTCRDFPRAPWWELPATPEGSLTVTGLLAGELLDAGAAGDWAERAAAWCLARVDAGAVRSPYDLRGVLRLLEATGDERAVERLAPAVREAVTLDPHAAGEVHGPLDFAPAPGSPARPLFSDAEIATHLDALEARQQPDGGWTFNWTAWSPGVAVEWRGVVTVGALLTLRAYGRL